jgi:NADPH2:quinone reductase
MECQERDFALKAAVYYDNGPASVLRYEDVPDPVVGAGDVLVTVGAISIEGGDILNRQLVPPPKKPHVVGYQAAGIVSAIGRNVKRVTLGQRVAAFNWSGSHAALFSVPEHFVFPVPAALDIKLAATIPVTFGTADDALFEFGDLKAGETVVIRGAAGGVGLAAVQLAKAADAIVIATASTDERLERLQSFGADRGINYMNQDLAAEVLRMTQGKGADLLIDMAGGVATCALLGAMRYRARVSIVGAAGGDFPNISCIALIQKSLALFGVSFGMEMHLPRVHELIGRHLERAAAGRLKMPIDRVFALRDAAAAHDYVQYGHPFGRVIMIP